MKVKVLICYPDGEEKIEEQELPEIAPEELQARKAERVADSKTALADYLASHPLIWTDGNQYSVTAEKQSLLTSQIALYQTATAAGQSYDLRWNSTGGECTSWTIEKLSALALAIGAYVQPLVSYQQAKELELLACETVEELDGVEVDYDTVHGAASGGEEETDSPTETPDEAESSETEGTDAART